ncbi:MAG: leucine-rich repeat domain-containing protein [Clostridia bacterium]|nr:leucine-rich repeat domain-containing protein [Clostridia bacterium]
MKEQKFFDLLGEIDPEIIAAADRPVSFRKKRGFAVMLVAAMMAILILATPVVGAFALAKDYRTQNPEFKGNMIGALDRALGKPDQPLSGIVAEALGVDPAALNTIFPDSGEINWNALLTVLRGDQEEQVPENPFFRAIEIDGNSMRIVAYTGTMETVIIPETINGLPVTEIGEHVFSKDETLQHVVIPDTVTLIDMGAFTACLNLQTVEMSENVEVIGDGAFLGCHSLTEITLPETLHTIEECAFMSCRSLEHLEIPSSVRVLGDGAFWSSGMTELVIPEGITVIPEAAFMSMKNLQKITLPSTITEIEIAAFEGCKSLEQITLNEGLVKIGRQAFSGTAIDSITIPSTVTDMYDIGFSECKNLKIVFFRGDAPTIEQPPTPPDSDAAPYYRAPDYTVCYLPGKTGFEEETWYGHACVQANPITDPIPE